MSERLDDRGIWLVINWFLDIGILSPSEWYGYPNLLREIGLRYLMI